MLQRSPQMGEVNIFAGSCPPRCCTCSLHDACDTQSSCGLSPLDERYIPGGAGLGSAVAVAANLASFTLGMATAGSGRMPAALNNLVGAKPTVLLRQVVIFPFEEQQWSIT